jgi:hypothetical protein
MCDYFSRFGLENLSMLQANSICKQGPLVCIELGVLFYHKKDYGRRWRGSGEHSTFSPSTAFPPPGHPLSLTWATSTGNYVGSMMQLSVQIVLHAW